METVEHMIAAIEIGGFAESSIEDTTVRMQRTTPEITVRSVS